MRRVSMSDRRPRYPLQVPLIYASWGRSTIPGAGWTWNLGEWGACIELAEAIPPQMSLDLRLHTGQGTYFVESQIAWTEDATLARFLGGGILHGVTFSGMAPIHRQGLRDLLLAQYGERRTAVRFSVDLPILSQPQGADAPRVLRGRTGNISRNGLLIRLGQTLSPGTVLKVTLQAPSGRITVTGEIVWVDPDYRQTFGDPIRHGLRFSAMDWTGPVALARFLAELTSALNSRISIRSPLTPIDPR